MKKHVVSCVLILMILDFTRDFLTLQALRLRNGQGIAQLVNCLPCKHGDLSSTQRIGVGKTQACMWYTFLIPVLRKQEMWVPGAHLPENRKMVDSA